MPCLFWKRPVKEGSQAPLQFVMGAYSHSGKVKNVNEDSFCYCNLPGAPMAMALVGDGIGGHQDGDIASNFMARLFLFRFRELLRKEEEPSRIPCGDFLMDCALEANKIMAEVNHSAGHLHPMGTTLVSCLFAGNRLFTLHAGDSRIYLFRKGKLSALTCDHSVVQELIRKGSLRQEDAPFHPMSHVITKAVGPRMKLRPEAGEFMLQRGDLVLLCSDGLLRHVTEKGIGAILKEKLPPSRLAYKLVMTSLYGGGIDNITAICVRVE